MTTSTIMLTTQMKPYALHAQEIRTIHKRTHVGVDRIMETDMNMGQGP
jgi:hypothetical protein